MFLVWIIAHIIKNDIFYNFCEQFVSSIGDKK